MEVEYKSAPMNKDDEIVGAVVVFHDISERKKREKLFRVLVESAPDATIISDAGGVIQMANHQSETLFGYDRSEMIDEKIELLIPDRFRNSHVEKRRRFAGGETIRPMGIEVELWGQTKDRAEFPVEVNLSPIETDRGTLYYSAIRDITQRKALEHELIKAKEAADYANEAKSTFLASMSHEIRTPLNGLVANLEFLKFSNIDREQRECVESAQFCADTLLGIIGDILDLSKIEAGKLELDMHPASLQDIMEEVLAMMRHRTGEKGLRLHGFIDPGLPRMVVSDSLRFRQVLINLIGNSAKFTEEGGIHVSLVRRTVEPSGTWIECRVLDSGAGFAPEKAEKLFEAFAQEDASTTRHFGGTGLGLAICKRIVELMGGWIRCEGHPGCGAAFEFSFPVEIVEDVDEASPVNLSDRRILIVGDDSDRIALAESKLRALGADTYQAVAGEELVNAGGCDGVVAVTDGPDRECWRVLLRDFNDKPRVTIAETMDRSFGHRAIRSGFGDYFTSETVDWNHVAHALHEKYVDTSKEDDTHERNVFSYVDIIKGAKIGRPVLVADDFPMNREVAKKQLGMLGLDCELVENGSEALERATAGGYSMILTDCNMPGMDGFEFTRRYREWESSRNIHIPVIAMTANALKGDSDKCLDAGMDDYVSKPVTLERLAEAVMRNLKISRRDVSMVDGGVTNHGRSGSRRSRIFKTDSR